jgi:hypothetical protein
VLEVLLRSRIGLEIEKRIFAPRETLFAPHLLDLEVAQVLRRYCASGEIDSKRGKEAIEDLKDLPINRYQHGIFLNRVWELRHNMTAFDADTPAGFLQHIDDMDSLNHPKLKVSWYLEG